MLSRCEAKQLSSWKDPLSRSCRTYLCENRLGLEGCMISYRFLSSGKGWNRKEIHSKNPLTLENWSISVVILGRKLRNTHIFLRRWYQKSYPGMSFCWSKPSPKMAKGVVVLLQTSIFQLPKMASKLQKWASLPFEPSQVRGTLFETNSNSSPMKRNTSQKETTVDGRNPAPPGMYKTL